jgi:hypothetical protein
MSTLPPEAFQHWVHAHEEDRAGLQVYRPATFSMAPSRGRVGFELRPTGEAVVHGPGPTDRTETMQGSWQASDPSHLRIDLPQTRFGGMTMEIVSIEPDRLVVRQIP